MRLLRRLFCRAFGHEALQCSYSHGEFIGEQFVVVQCYGWYCIRCETEGAHVLF